MENKFNFSMFIDEYLNNIDLKKKRNKKNKLNLSSNELIHSKLIDINKKISKTLDFNAINKYVYYPDELNCMENILNLPKENFCLFAGSDNAIKLIMATMGKNSGNIIIQTPNYENYYKYCFINKINVHEWILRNNLDFNLLDGIKLLKQFRNSLVVITNPNGFTGKSLSYDEIKKILQICVETSNILIIDCAYSAFDNINYSDLFNDYDNLIIINSLSKSYGLCGGRFAYVRSSKKVIEYLSCFNSINAISALTFEIVKLYSIYSDDFTIIREEIKKSRKDFIEFVNEETNWKALDSNSNFVLLKLKDRCECDKLEKYLNNNNIVIRNLNNIINLDNCIRITITEKLIMEEVKAKLLIFNKLNYEK